MARDFNDSNQGRYQGRDFDEDRNGRNSENWGSGRGGYSGSRQQGFEDRGQGQQAQQGDYNRYGSQGRGNDFGSDYGSSRFAGPGGGGDGGYGGGQRYQDDRSSWNRQQQAFDQSRGSGQQGRGGERYNSNQGEEGYGSREYGTDYGTGRQYGQSSHWEQRGGGSFDSQYGGGQYGRSQQGGRQYGGRESYGERSGYGGYGQGASQGHHHDPDYQQWRNEQLRNLDDDYNSWRGERYKKFSDDFNSWRNNRSQANVATGQQESS